MTYLSSKVLVPLLLAAAGCIGINPVYDGPPPDADDEVGTTTDPTGAGTGSTGEAPTSVDTSTTSRTFSTGAGETDETDGHTDDTTETSGSSDIETCLSMGLDVCQTGDQIECVDLEKDIRHCGSCFNDCGSAEAAKCDQGTCSCGGGPWWALCLGQCTYVREDPEACGQSCTDCIAIYGEGATCEMGSCQEPPDDSGGDDDDG